MTNIPVPVITSTQNPKVKRLLVLRQKSSARREEGLFLVEGSRELLHCVNAGYSVDSLFVCPELMNEAVGAGRKAVLSTRDFENKANVLDFLDLRDGADGSAIACYAVTPAVYEKIAYRGGSEGVVATVRMKTPALHDLSLSAHPLLVVVESVEKPGNLGAILRTADAAKADAVIVCDPLTDLYNPNLIRSSVGAVFTVPCVACTSEECIRFLRQRGISILTAQLQDSRLYYETDMTRGIALVMGTEATGLTDVWRQAADAHIRIPMLGQIDSLNVSVSTAVLLFEAVRQRNL